MPNDTAQLQRLRDALKALPGVRRVMTDGPPDTVYLICDPPGGTPPIEAAARAILGREQGPGGGVALQISYLDIPQQRRRVRFVGAEQSHPRTGVVAVSVTLEWNDRIFEGTAEGETSPAGDLRVCANAALRALEHVLEGAHLTFHLVGVKTVRIFDNELIALVLDLPHDSGQRLIGTSLVVDDPCRSAALAVLNATNRVLGNYLSTSD